MPSKESLAVALPMVCKRLQWSEATPSAFVMEWANAVADLLDEAIREARISEHKLSCGRCALGDAEGSSHKSLTCARLAQLREGNT